MRDLNLRMYALFQFVSVGSREFVLLVLMHRFRDTLFTCFFFLSSVGNMKYFFRFSALLGSTIFLTFIHNNIKILIRLLKLESACGSYSAVRH